LTLLCSDHGSPHGKVSVIFNIGQADGRNIAIRRAKKRFFPLSAAYGGEKVPVFFEKHGDIFWEKV